MTLKDTIKTITVDNLEQILLSYGCSCSMMKLLTGNYVPMCKILCWSSAELKTCKHVTIYRHALFGIIILDRLQHQIYMDSSKYKQFYFWCKEKGYNIHLEKDGTF